MIRVLLVCEDHHYCDKIREYLNGQLDFQVLGNTPLGPTAVEEARRLLPDVTVLVVDDAHGLAFADAFKMELPDLPLFLMSRGGTLATEHLALSYRVDAVFLAENELPSLASNAREICH